MTDLTQNIVHKDGSMEILTANQITFKHRGDKVMLRGPLHAMVRMIRPNGKEKGTEELVLQNANVVREIECNENPNDQYDVQITDMGALPGPTTLDLVVERKHMDVLTTGTFAAYHQNDMIRLRGPARYRVEYRGKSGNVRRAEDVSLNTPNDVREFVNRSNEEDMYIIPTMTGQPAQAPAPAPAPAPALAPAPQMPAPVAGGAFTGKLPDGTLIKSPNSNTVYVMESGAKRPLTLESFNKYGYKWEALWTIPENVVVAIPTGPAKL